MKLLQALKSRAYRCIERAVAIQVGIFMQPMICFAVQNAWAATGESSKRERIAAIEEGRGPFGTL